MTVLALLLAVGGTDAAAALRAYSLRAPMFYETEVRAYGFFADHDGTAIFGGGAGVGVALHRIVTPVGAAMTSSWTALRVGTAARLAGASGAPHVRLEIPFLFGAERAMGGIAPGANWRGTVLGAAVAPQVIVGSGFHGAWVRAEAYLDRVALEGPKERQLRFSLALQAPVGYPETSVSVGAAIAWY